jgi:hypothetical protein
MKYLCIKKDILATLNYFNLFNYPLRKGEIFVFLGHCDKYPEFAFALENLLEESFIFKIGEFYSLHNNYKLAERRVNGNERAFRMLKKANHGAALISAFPFVKGVAISGSLSKYFADEEADIDFFIITSANRLWIARTLLHIFKKFTFLFHMQDYFCMNYFIDEQEMEIPEKNIYTATEIVTLLPLRGRVPFENFYASNNWTHVFFPNKYRHILTTRETKTNWLKYITEKVLDNRIGDRLDNFFMKMTARSWSKKTRANKKNSKGLLMDMQVSKHFSRPNPEIFQKKLLQRYENNLADIFKRYEFSYGIKNRL